MDASQELARIQGEAIHKPAAFRDQLDRMRAHRDEAAQQIGKADQQPGQRGIDRSQELEPVLRPALARFLKEPA